MNSSNLFWLRLTDYNASSHPWVYRAHITVSPWVFNSYSKSVIGGATGEFCPSLSPVYI
jgi:hypothetical protein